MEAISQLVPFQFKNFVFTESFEAPSINDAIRRHRFTRKSIGERWGAKDPEHYINILIHRHPNLSEGIGFTVKHMPFTVKGETGQEYIVKTHDAFDMHSMAIYSDLPKAKEFMEVFPEFLLALQARQFKPLPPDIYQVAQIPNWTHGKGKLLEQIAQERGKSVGTIRRMMKRVKRGEPLEKPRPRYIQIPNREKFEQVIQMKKENPGLRGFQIAQQIGVPKATVYVWLKKSDPNQTEPMNHVGFRARKAA